MGKYIKSPEDVVRKYLESRKKETIKQLSFGIPIVSLIFATNWTIAEKKGFSQTWLFREIVNQYLSKILRIFGSKQSNNFSFLFFSNLFSIVFFFLFIIYTFLVWFVINKTFTIINKKLNIKE